jgi:hypothetical protein
MLAFLEELLEEAGCGPLRGSQQDAVRKLFVDVLKERDAALVAVLDLLRQGAVMADCSYNLGQRGSAAAHDVEVLARSGRDWDAAAHAARSRVGLVTPGT